MRAGKVRVSSIDVVEAGLSHGEATQIQTAELAAMQPQQIGDVARGVAALIQRQSAQGVQEADQLSLDSGSTADARQQALQYGSHSTPSWLARTNSSATDFISGVRAVR